MTAKTSNRRLLLVWLVVALLAWLDYAHPLVRQPVDAAFLGALLTAIAAAFGWLADKAVTLAVVLYQVAVLIGQAIFHALVAVGTVFVKVYDFLGKFWSNVLKPFISWAWRQFTELHAWLKRTFQPALDFLWKVRHKLLELYDRYVRPIVDTIEVMRRLLQLLAFLKLEWARELDRKLAELEARITRPLLEAMRVLNLAMNWINRIVDFDGYFQRLTLVASLLKYERDAWKVWWVSVRGREVDKGPVATGPVPESTPAAAAETVTSYMRGADVPEFADVEEHAADLWAEIGRAGALPF